MNKKLNVGIIGLGRIARSGHAPEISAHLDKFNLAACADIEPERLKNLPKEFEKAKKYHSLEEMLENPALDLITICTRHACHVPMALQIMAAGKIAIVEKPVATSVAEMELLRIALKKYPGKLYFRHNRRFEAPFTKARQLIADGLIGDVQYIKLCRDVGYSRRNDWMTMTEFYGGLLTNWGPHLIDQALCLLDSKVVDIWADVRNVISIGDGDDLFKIILKAENGRLADIEVTGANTIRGRQMEIIGSRGTIVYNTGDDKIESRYVDPSIKFKKLSPHPENPPFRYGNFDETLSFVESKFDIPAISMDIYWIHLYNAIVKNVPFPVTFDQAWNVVKIMEDVFKKSGFQPIKKFIPQKINNEFSEVARNKQP